MHATLSSLQKEQSKEKMLTLTAIIMQRYPGLSAVVLSTGAPKPGRGHLCEPTGKSQRALSPGPAAWGPS